MRIHRQPSLALAFVAAAVALPTAAVAHPPVARTAIQCGTISTSNGGQARFLNTYRMRCDAARRIARKARGRRYTALAGKFTCKPKRTSGISGLSYFCQNSGTTRSLGFIYRAP